MTAERVRDPQSAVGAPAGTSAGAAGHGDEERPAARVWLINLGMGPQFHALPAADDPGSADPRGFEAVRWPTVDAAAACGPDGRFRRGAFQHADLPRCLSCCAATDTEEGYGPWTGAPTDSTDGSVR